MANIPLSIGTRSLETGSVVQYPTGDPIGKAMEGAGHDIAKMAKGWEEELVRRNARIERFTALKDFAALGTELQTEIDTAKQTMQPGAIGLHDKLMTSFDKRSSEWLSTAPPSVKDEFAARVQERRADFSRSAALIEHAEATRFQTSSITERVGVAKQGIQQAGPDAIATWVKDVDQFIDAAPALTPVAKAEAKKSIREDLATVGFRSLAEKDPQAAQNVAAGWGLSGGFTGTAQERTMQLLRAKEGFRSSTYWDVNAHRVGYGSDTITDANGVVRAVKQGDTVSRDDAERDLKRRSAEFLSGVQRDVGAEAFAKLNPNQQAALGSVAYNYGSLPGSVVAAVKSGDSEAIAKSIEGLQGNNGGVNRQRRLAEANLARFTGDGVPTGVHEPDSRFDAVPADKRFVLANAAEQEFKKMRAGEAAQASRDHAGLFNDLQKNVIDGKATLADVDQARKDGWLTDAREILQVQHQIAARDKGLADTQNFNKALNTPGFVWNQVDKEHKDWAEAGFTALGGDMNALQTVANRTGIIPPSAAVALRGGLASSNPQRAEASLQTAANLIGGPNPNIFTGVEQGKDLADAATTFREYVYGRGMSAADATRKILEERTPEFEQSVKAKIKKEDLDQVVKKNLTDGDIRGAFDPSFLGLAPNPQLTFNPEMRQRAMGDYETAFRDHFLRNGDVSLSKNLALAEMKRTWGTTHINGSTFGNVMKYPPERAPAYAGMGDVPAMFARQALASIKEWNGADVDRSKLVIMESRDTAERYMRGQAPTYMLGYADKSGVFQAIPKPFFADPAQMRADLTAQRQAGFTAARAADDVTIGQTPDQQAAIADRRAQASSARQRLIDEGTIVPGAL